MVIMGRGCYKENVIFEGWLIASQEKSKGRWQTQKKMYTGRSEDTDRNGNRRSKKF